MLYIYIYIYSCVCIYVYLYILHVCVYICVYIYIYICVHTHPQVGVSTVDWVFRHVVFQDVGFETNSFKPLRSPHTFNC